MGFFGAALILGGLNAVTVLSQDDPVALTPGELKKLSLEELSEIQVTLVSRSPEKLAEAASAIQVITRDDIRRSGAMTLADALRLATNLQVAQINATTWAISARGMNSSTNTLPNKLLVMIDGRTVYTPLYAGVHWGQQQLILDHVDRIEVVSGPGGSVWGANAVNGVINIVTLPAAQTRGLFAEGGGGTFMREFAAGSIGGRAGESGFWRAYGQRLDHGGSALANGGEAADDWILSRGGLRADLEPTPADRLTLQAEAAAARTEQALPGPGYVDYDAQFAQARWTRTFSETSDLQAKAYFDRTWLDLPGTLAEELLTYDLEAWHAFAPLAGNRLLWGAGYRLQIDRVENPPPGPGVIELRPARKVLPLYSLYAQDQQDLFGERLRLTLGGRLEHNAYTGFEAMPSFRAAWTYVPGQTAWMALSRAVRSPGRLDVEAFQAPLEGGPDLVPEILNAAEIGWRIGMGSLAALTASAFMHSYEELRILEQATATRFEFANGLQGEIYGVELTGDLQAAAGWRMRAGYTYLVRDLYPIAGHSEFPQPGNNGNDPAWQATMQSYLDLPRGFGVNGVARFMDNLPAPAIPGYFTFDLGATWRWRFLELSVLGRNLAQESHPEARVHDLLPMQEIPRSVAGRASLRF